LILGGNTQKAMATDARNRTIIPAKIAPSHIHPSPAPTAVPTVILRISMIFISVAYAFSFQIDSA